MAVYSYHDPWHKVGDPGEPDFVKNASGKGWLGDVYFRKTHSGIVEINFKNVHKEDGAGTLIFNLPIDYRPEFSHKINLHAWGGHFIYFHVLESDGEVRGTGFREGEEGVVGANQIKLTYHSSQTTEEWIDPTPSGTVQAFAGTAIPTGYLECDGSEVSRTEYETLFDAIGTQWGEGDAVTTFNIPNIPTRFYTCMTFTEGLYGFGFPGFGGVFAKSSDIMEPNPVGIRCIIKS